jgi:hypothetical protein
MNQISNDSEKYTDKVVLQNSNALDITENKKENRNFLKA